MVMVCALFQFSGVKVSWEVLKLPSVASERLSPMITLAVGWVIKTKRMVADSPDSVVCTSVCVTSTPKVSLRSLICILTVWVTVSPTASMAFTIIS